MSVNGVHCLRKLEAKIQIVDGNYLVPKLWKEKYKQLPNDYPLAEQRLKLLQKKSEKDEKLFQKYEETIATYITQGNAKKTSQEEL